MTELAPFLGRQLGLSSMGMTSPRPPESPPWMASGWGPISPSEPPACAFSPINLTSQVWATDHSAYACASQLTTLPPADLSHGREILAM